MHFQLKRLALIGGLTVTLCAAILGGQTKARANQNPPASPQAKTQPATHFTQGTIDSIEANLVVISRKVRGKTTQVSFVMDSQTKRSGSLAAGNRVSVQYREASSQKIAAAVRELPAAAAVKVGKTNTP